MLPLAAQLSMREPVPCVELTATAAELIAVTRTDDHGPMAPVRAAECLALLFSSDPAFTTEAEGWMRDPGQLGLALVVARRELPALTVEKLNVALAQNPSASARARVSERLGK